MVSGCIEIAHTVGVHVFIMHNQNATYNFGIPIQLTSATMGVMSITPRRLQKITDVVSARLRGAVVLEDIHDPHNAAAILRSCDAFGIQDVYFIFDKTKPYNPKRIGKASSSSANKWLTYHIYHDIESCFDDLKKKGYVIASTILDLSAKSLYDYQVPQQPVALVIGNEHAGISELAANRSDTLIYIPMQGFVESFNVSVCAAICLFELSRQKRTASYEATLTPDQQQALIDDFISR